MSEDQTLLRDLSDKLQADERFLTHREMHQLCRLQQAEIERLRTERNEAREAARWCHNWIATVRHFHQHAHGQRGMNDRLADIQHIDPVPGQYGGDPGGQPRLVLAGNAYQQNVVHGNRSGQVKSGLFYPLASLAGKRGPVPRVLQATAADRHLQKPAGASCLVYTGARSRKVAGTYL